MTTHMQTWGLASVPTPALSLAPKIHLRHVCLPAQLLLCVTGPMNSRNQTDNSVREPLSPWGMGARSLEGHLGL